MIDLYECKIYYKDTLLKNIVSIDEDFITSPVHYAKIQYIDDDGILRSIIANILDFKFILPKGYRFNGAQCTQ